MTINVTLNPNDMKAGSGTLSNNNLTFSITQSQANIRATHGKTAGKWYWEVKLVSGENGVLIGVANKSYPINSTALAGTSGDALNIRGYIQGYKEPENAAYGSTITVSDIVGVALDLDSQKLEFFKNGVSMGVSHTNLAVLGELFPFISSNSSISKVVTVNFGASAFAYPVPIGYKAFDTPLVNKFLISSEDKYFSLSPKKRTGEYMIPIMTSNKDSLTGIELIGDPKTSTTWGAWGAFDRVTVKPGLAWISETSQSEAGWIIIHIPNNKIVPFSYVIQGYLSGMTDLNYVPTAWNFYGSHNGTNWTVLDSQSGVTGWVDGVYKEYLLTTNEAHQYYKIEITANPNGRKSIGDFNIIAGISNAYSTINKTTIGEIDFINYGLNKNDKIDLNDKISVQNHIVSDSTILGSGKVYRKTIDLSKISIKKVTIT